MNAFRGILYGLLIAAILWGAALGGCLLALEIHS